MNKIFYILDYTIKIVYLNEESMVIIIGLAKDISRLNGSFTTLFVGFPSM